MEEDDSEDVNSDTDGLSAESDVQDVENLFDRLDLDQDDAD